MKTPVSAILATSSTPWPWIGQTRLGSLLLQLLDGTDWPGTVMFVGSENLGKRTVALWLAQRDLCRQTKLRPCQQCHDCRQVQAGTHPRCLVATGPDGQPPKVEDIQRVRQRLHWKTTTADGARRWLVIPDVDQVNETVGNSLLKVIEEPPPRTAVVMTSSYPTRVLPTIRSRAVLMRWADVAWSELEQAMAERWPALSSSVRRTIARQAGGRPGLAVMATQRPEQVAERWATAETLMSGWQTGRWPARREWSSTDLDLAERLIRDAVLVCVGAIPQTWPHQTPRLQAFAAACGRSRLIVQSHRLLQRADYLRQHVQPALFLYDLGL